MFEKRNKLMLVNRLESKVQIDDSEYSQMFFPDEGHWVMKPQNSILWQRVFFEWLDKYLK